MENTTAFFPVVKPRGELHDIQAMDTNAGKSQVQVAKFVLNRYPLVGLLKELLTLCQKNVVF